MTRITHDVSLSRGIMVGVWLESVFWGLHSGFVVLCIWVFKYRRRHLRGGVLTVTLIMYVLATIHCFAELSRMINGFIDHQGALAIFTRYNTVNDVGRMLIYALNNSLSDAVVLWRCIVVWQRNWLACSIPIMLLMGMTINGLYVTTLFAGTKPDDAVSTARVIKQQTIFFAFSLATNSITTAFVAARIWWLAHKVSVPGLDCSRYNHVVAMLIESGLLYSSLKICELVLFVLQSNAFYIVFDSIVQIMCIAPTAIFIWVALGATEGSKYNKTMDRGGPSLNIGAFTGASFRFARPTAAHAGNTFDAGMGNCIGVTAHPSYQESIPDSNELYRSTREYDVEKADVAGRRSLAVRRSETVDSMWKDGLTEEQLDFDEDIIRPRALRAAFSSSASSSGASSASALPSPSSTKKDAHQQTDDIDSLR